MNAKWNSASTLKRTATYQNFVSWHVFLCMVVLVFYWQGWSILTSNCFLSVFRPFSGKYLRQKEEGIYVCIVCDNPLFHSDHKYETMCGWPSFTDVITQGKVTVKKDTSHGKIDLYNVFKNPQGDSCHVCLISGDIAIARFIFFFFGWLRPNPKFHPKWKNTISQQVVLFLYMGSFVLEHTARSPSPS